MTVLKDVCQDMRMQHFLLMYKVVPVVKTEILTGQKSNAFQMKYE